MDGSNPGKPESVTAALPPKVAAALRAAVESGEYVTEGEVVREALDDWLYGREQRERAVEELRRLVDEGLASGEPQDGEEAMAEIRAWLEAEIEAGLGAEATTGSR